MSKQQTQRDGADYSDRDVRAYLRAATKEGILKGWNNFQSTNRLAPGGKGPLKWTVSPAGRATQVLDQHEVREYCYMINLVGIVPLYIEV
jgi:hypothetical protein